jgi:hypothetical protein
LDTNLCYRPANYQNIEIRLDKWKYQCGDTLRAHLQTGYFPPNFSYQWIPDSMVVVRPINGKAPTINLKTYGSNPLCNQDWKITPNTNCAYCKDTSFSPRIKSSSSFDNFFCPNPIVRTYTPIGSDTSLHWYYLKPPPITYTNQVYYVKNVVYNQYCRDTITTDTLFLHCNIPCAFPQKACAHIICNKQSVYKGEVIQYTAVCDSHCTGFSYEWDNGLSTESLPLSYPDTTYTKKLYCWNSFGIRDTLIHTIKVKWGSGTEQFSSSVIYGIENNQLNIYTERKVNSIELYDMLGNRCLNAENIKQIDLSNFAKGIYILHIKIDGEMIIQKMVR